MTMIADTDTKQKDRPAPDVADALPVDQLKAAGQEFLQALMVRVLNSASGRVQGMTKRLTDVAEQSGSAGAKAVVTGAEALTEDKSPLKAGLKAGVTGAKETVKGALKPGDGGEGGGKGGPKVTNIVEEFDVGLPLRAAYNQWTQFADYPSFTKRVESVEQESDEKVTWRAQIFLSHRSWESTIIEQIPDKRIVWKSEGAKGYVDGAVTFHELAPTMTRIMLVAEYHPDGFLEKTANLWRAQGRRLRLEYKHIKRHMMTRTLLEQDEAEGWRGEIRDGEVVKTHEEALKEEQGEGEEAEGRRDEEPEGREGESREDQGAEGRAEAR